MERTISSKINTNVKLAKISWIDKIMLKVVYVMCFQKKFKRKKKLHFGTSGTGAARSCIKQTCNSTADNSKYETPVNPDQLELIYKEGAIGVHDLFKHYEVAISYEKADELWCDFSQYRYMESCKQFPAEEITKSEEYAHKLFACLYLYYTKVATSIDDWNEVDFVLHKIIKTAKPQ